MYNWDFGFLLEYYPAFLRGTVMTLVITLTSFSVGVIFGLLLGIAYHMLPTFLKKIALVVNDAARAIPMLVMLFIVYYFPYTKMLGIAAPSPLYCAIIAFALSQSVYTADLVLTSIKNVPSNLIMAGKSLGLPKYIVWRELILPDVFRQILPAHMAFFIGTLRLSSIASVIGAYEVVFVARTVIARSFRSLEAWLIVAAIYIAIVIPIAYVVRLIQDCVWLRRKM